MEGDRRYHLCQRWREQDRAKKMRAKREEAKKTSVALEIVGKERQGWREKTGARDGGNRRYREEGERERVFIFRIANTISKASTNLTRCRRHAIHCLQRHKFFWRRQKGDFADDNYQPSAETHICQWIEKVASANDPLCRRVNILVSAYDTSTPTKL